MKKIVFIVVTSTFLLGSAGCVAQGDYDKAQDRVRTLDYKASVAERGLNEKNQELALQRQKTRLAEQEINDLKQRIAKNDARLATVAKTVAQNVRAEVDAEYQKRFDELRASVPSVEVSAYGGLVLESGIFFKPGWHQLQPTGKSTLMPLIEKLKGPDFQAYTVEVAGHTDSDPVVHSRHRYSDNHILAANRANEVRRLLISHGIAADKVYITAWGSQRPLTPDAPKAKNRRVEIVLHKDEPKFTTMEASSPR